MKFQYLIIFLIMGIFFWEAQAMSPKKGGATAAPDLPITGTKCGGKKVSELKCDFSPSSGAAYVSKNLDCWTKDKPIEIKNGKKEIIGTLAVKADLYQGAKDTLKSEYCMNISTNLYAHQKEGVGMVIPTPSDPLTLKFFIYNDLGKPPVYSEAVSIKINKSRVGEALEKDGLKNGFTVTFRQQPDMSIKKVEFSLLPVVSGDYLKLP